MFKNLIGARLLDLTDEGILVEKDGKVYRIEIDDDSGDCCGYNEITTNLLCTKDSRPVITNIEHTVDDSDCDSESAKVVFFGECKPIAEINTLSSSGSGWGYGATVTLISKALNISEVVSSW